MEKHFFRYQILRYIADLRRMETENFGIIVQNDEKTSCRFRWSPGARHGFDSANYRNWRNFFTTEITGPAVPFFQPHRGSVEFLEYLQERCAGNYSLTRPLELVLDGGELKEAEDYLFRTLVLKPDEVQKSIKQPVQQLRHELDKRGIIGHPAFHSRATIQISGLTEFVEYYYVRNHGANLPVIIQPVQNMLDPTITSNQMERAEALVANLHEAKVRSEISVVVDTIPEPKANDKDSKKWAYERVEKGKRNLRARGIRVISSTVGTTELAVEVRKDLDGIEVVVPQPELAL